MKPALVQTWFRDLGLAPKSKGHIKAVMHRLFEKAMLWEPLPIDRNPMQLVELKGISKRTKKPIVLADPQPADCASTIAYTSAIRPPVTVTAPARS